jgi:signal transduction histidine kinase
VPSEVAVKRTARAVLNPPFREPRFWGVLAATALVFTFHQATDGRLGIPFIPDVPHQATLILFLLPIMYAALTFGMVGAAGTTLLCVALTGADLLMEVPNPNLPGDLGVTALEVAMFGVIAVVVGQRVEAERAARRAAEVSGERHRMAKELHQALFDGNQSPILLVGNDGTVRQMNSRAQALLEDRSGPQATLADMLGDEVARNLLHGADGDVVDVAAGGEHHVFRTLCNTVPGEDGTDTVQIALSDVTAEALRLRQTAMYAAHVLGAQEEERRRIAHELHDDPVQALVLLCRRLDRAREVAPLDERASDELEAARATAEDVIRGLRDLAKGLRPPALDDLGLVACVHRLVVDVRERSGIDCAFAVTGDVLRLPPATELALFRITQEALSNVERHASPRRTDVRLSFREDSVAIEVEDDGVGFVSATPAPGAAPATLGIIGMSERAALVGGRFSLVSAPMKGTRLSCVVPLRRPAIDRDDGNQPQPRSAA